MEFVHEDNNFGYSGRKAKELEMISIKYRQHVNTTT